MKVISVTPIGFTEDEMARARLIASATITAGGTTVQPGPDTGMATGRPVLVALEHARHVLATWDGETL